MAPVEIVWTRDGQAPARVQTFSLHGSVEATTGDTAGAAGVLRDALPAPAGSGGSPVGVGPCSTCTATPRSEWC